jgi:hypothetical protein
VLGTADWDVVLIRVGILDAVRPCGKLRCQARGALPASLLGTASHVNAGCRTGGRGM